MFQLGRMLPHEVSVAVECPEEPYDHLLQPGDVEIRFRTRGAYDIGGPDILVEVRSKGDATSAQCFVTDSSLGLVDVDDHAHGVGVVEHVAEPGFHHLTC